jgi:hypothetical protein
MAKRSFLVQLDDDDMEYPAFDAQSFAEALLRAMKHESEKQKLGVSDIEINYLGSN